MAFARVQSGTFLRTACALFIILSFLSPTSSMAIDDLGFEFLAGSMYLCWTAPGDDGRIGRATAYDLRYSTTTPGTDTLAWWNNATAVAGEPTPAWAGTRQCLTITGLENDRDYYFAIRARDDAGNWSPYSNIASTIFEYFACADVDSDGRFSVLDIVYLSNNIFHDGPEPAPETGDVNNNGIINILDLIYMVNYRFKGGPVPICP
jgi:hypothetical protein